MSDKNNLSIEQALERLEEIAAMMNEENLSLEKSLELYSEGVKLIEYCDKEIKNSKLKIVEFESSKDA